MKFDLEDRLEDISQEQYDDWIEGDYQLSDFVREHKFLAKMFKGRIMQAIEKHTPVQILQELRARRPDLEIRDKEKVIERIEEEIEEIKSMLE